MSLSKRFYKWDSGTIGHIPYFNLRPIIKSVFNQFYMFIYFEGVINIAKSKK